LSDKTVAAFSAIIKPGRPVAPGTCIIRQGDPANSLYTARMGSVKGVLGAADGAEQVIAFYYPSELIGLDSLEGGTYRSSAFALERTALCEIPIQAFEALCQHDPEVFHHFVHDLAEALAVHEQHTLELTKLDTEQRLAVFLFSLSQRQHARGLSTTDLTFSMSRYDIANHLGMASETVSRAFTHLEREGVLEVARKAVHIRDFERLRELSQAVEAPTERVQLQV
jgi:CRP/FNR family transcriptional regulator